jgi:hypothetical protein
VSVAGNQDFPANGMVSLNNQDAAPLPGRSDGGHQAGRSAADNNGLVFQHKSGVSSGGFVLLGYHDILGPMSALNQA